MVMLGAVVDPEHFFLGREMKLSGEEIGSKIDQLNCIVVHGMVYENTTCVIRISRISPLLCEAAGRI